MSLLRERGWSAAKVSGKDVRPVVGVGQGRELRFDGDNDHLRTRCAGSRLLFVPPLVVGCWIVRGRPSNVHGNPQNPIIIHRVVRQRFIYREVKALVVGVLFRHQREEDVESIDIKFC